ncbi:MAG: hypothetical protein WCL51_17750 [Bacteroidota bacterium]
MEAILIQPKNKSEFKFLVAMLKKLNVNIKTLDIEDKEDLGLVELMKQADRSQKLTRDEVMAKLTKK